MDALKESAAIGTNRFKRRHLQGLDEFIHELIHDAQGEDGDRSDTRHDVGSEEEAEEDGHDHLRNRAQQGVEDAEGLVDRGLMGDVTSTKVENRNRDDRPDQRPDKAHLRCGPNRGNGFVPKVIPISRRIDKRILVRGE